MKKKRKLLSVTRCTVKKSAFLIAGLLLAFPLWAQTANDRVTLRARGQSAVEVLKALEAQTSYKFMFHDEDLLRLGNRDIDVRNVQLGEALDVLLRDSGMTYEIVGNQIVFRRETGQRQQAARNITGVITDAAGKPVVGASVVVEGTNIGVSSDGAGRFTLRALTVGNPVLIVKFIGYKDQRVETGTQTEFRIIMEETALNVDEVVVTGYTTIDKGSYVGAVTVVNADDIQIAGESSIDQMLQGIVPGMSVINTTGKVGGTPKIRIRGTSTIIGNQEPLWVVDGVIQRDPLPLEDTSTPLYSEMEGLRETAANAISWLNPSDIQTITVLKDASATAIYGSQASNGVIVVTTKKASGVGLNISYSGNFSIGQKPGYQMYDQMNSQELMAFSQDLYMDRDSYTNEIMEVGYGGLVKRLHSDQITLDEFKAEFRRMEGQNTDWFDLLFRNSFSQSHNVSVSGMGENVHSRFSVGFNRQNGEAKGNDLTGFTANSTTTFRLGSRLIIDLNLNGSYRETSDFAFGVNPFSYAMNTARTIPMYNDDGTYYYHGKRGQSSYSIPNKTIYLYNIQNEIDNTGAKNRTLVAGASINLTLNLLEGLQFRTTASYQISSSTGKSWATEYSNYVTQIRRYEIGEVLPNSPEQHASVLPFGGVLISENGVNNNFSFRPNLLYSKVFNDIHTLTLNLGFEAISLDTDADSYTRYGYLYYRGEGFATVPTSTINLVTSVKEDLHEKMRRSNRIVTTRDNKISEYFTAIYSYDGRYVINANARLDASNRFGQDKNKKFNPSWSIGAKWRVGNEYFMERYGRWLDMFDISASYGFRGNAVQAVSPYMIATDGGFNNRYQQYTLLLRSLAYPNLGWERTHDWNLGLDFSFFEGRLSATANLYGSTSKVLSRREVPVENGVEDAYIEGTESSNRGYDLNIGVVPVRTQNVTWSLSFNASKQKNTIKKNERINTLNDYLSGNAIVNGEAYGTIYAYDFDGLDNETGIPTFKHMDIERTEEIRDFLIMAGCTEPNFFGGFNTSFRYKNLRVNAIFAVSFGAQKFLPAVYPSSGIPTPEVNLPRYMLDRWRNPGDQTDIPAVPGGNPLAYQIELPTVQTNNRYSAYEMYNQSDARIADTDFIRCRNISLAYDIPVELTKKLHLKRVTISANMTNPFAIVFDKAWDGIDPETGSWPARRTASLSLGITF